MPRDATETRTRIMDAAERLVLERGFAGTTVDEIVRRAGITKGTFFYHFDTKADLAHGLVERYAEMDRRHLEEGLERAEDETDDPLEQLVLFVRGFEEQARTLTEPSPGCLFASYCYERGLFDDRTREVVDRAVLRWRERLTAKLREAAASHPPREEMDLEALADTLWALFEGAFILSKTLREPDAITRQLAIYRALLRRTFS